MNENFDVVVIGGGAAGLSGAVALARSRRSVLVVDSGDQRNASAAAVHNFLTRDGAPPAEILRLGRSEVTRYGGRVETGRVTALRREGGGFMVEMGDRAVAAKRLRGLAWDFNPRQTAHPTLRPAPQGRRNLSRVGSDHHMRPGVSAAARSVLP